MTAGKPGRPPILTDPVNITIALERAQLDKVDATATARGISRSALIRAALTVYYADGGPR